MRKILLLALVLCAPSAAQAEVIGLTGTCDQFATAFADQATQASMIRAGERETSGPGRVLIIAGGNKFFIPAKQVDDRSLAPASAWQRMRNWNSAYSDAFWNCRHSDNVTLQAGK